MDEWLIAIPVILIVGIWVYRDATDRGSSAAILWTIGVMAMMIIFLPLYLMFRPKKILKIEAINPPSLCPHCGKYHEGKPKFCPNCGHSLIE